MTRNKSNNATFHASMNGVYFVFKLAGKLGSLTCKKGKKFYERGITIRGVNNRVKVCNVLHVCMYYVSGLYVKFFFFFFIGID